MRNYAARAFTLIELMAVVMVIGIIAAVVIPSISPSGDMRVAAAARIIMTDLQYAQSQAISTQKKVYVLFSAVDYSLKTRPNDAAALQSMTHPVNNDTFVVQFTTGNLSEVTLDSTSLASKDGIAFDETGTPLLYDGLANSNSTLTTRVKIRIQSRGSYMMIVLAPYTGEISLIEG